MQKESLGWKGRIPEFMAPDRSNQGSEANLSEALTFLTEYPHLGFATLIPSEKRLILASDFQKLPEAVKKTSPFADVLPFLQRQPRSQSAIDAADHFALPFQDCRIATQEISKTSRTYCKDHRAQEA